MKKKPWAAAQLGVTTAARAFWQQRSAREQQLLVVAGALLLVWVLWRWAWMPAWQTWREAPMRQAQVVATTQRMLLWQQQAQALKSTAVVDATAAWNAVQQNTQLLGEGVQATRQGQQVVVTWPAASAEGLTKWLDAMRTQAQLVPEQVNVMRVPDTDAVTWSGRAVLRAAAL